MENQEVVPNRHFFFYPEPFTAWLIELRARATRRVQSRCYDFLYVPEPAEWQPRFKGGLSPRDAFEDWWERDEQAQTVRQMKICLPDIVIRMSKGLQALTGAEAPLPAFTIDDLGNWQVPLGDDHVLFYMWDPVPERHGTAEPGWYLDRPDPTTGSRQVAFFTFPTEASEIIAALNGDAEVV